MHTSTHSYFNALADKKRLPLTIKAVRSNLPSLVVGWESRFSSSFDSAMLRTSNLHTWRFAWFAALIESEADLAIVQCTFRHCSIATSGIYLTPRNDDLHRAVELTTL